MAKWIFLIVAFTNFAFAKVPTLGELTNFILANEQTYVHSYENDKIYLEAEHLVFSEEGVFLNVKGIALPVQTDWQGAFVRWGFGDWILNKCPGCKKSYFLTCKTEGCPYNPQTKES